MCSFTESVDDDLPPAPELPPSLDIDYQYSKTMSNENSLSTKIDEMVGILYTLLSSNYFSFCYSLYYCFRQNNLTTM